MSAAEKGKHISRTLSSPCTNARAVAARRATPTETEVEGRIVNGVSFRYHLPAHDQHTAEQQRHLMVSIFIDMEGCLSRVRNKATANRELPEPDPANQVRPDDRREGFPSRMPFRSFGCGCGDQLSAMASCGDRAERLQRTFWEGKHKLLATVRERRGLGRARDGATRPC